MESNKNKSEDAIQAEFFKSSWEQFPQTRRLIFAVPNGGTRNMLEAMKFKATGLISGIPDMLFVWKGKVYGLEFKTETGRTSKDQDKVHEVWIANGTPVRIFRDAQSALDWIKYIIENA